MFERMMEDVFYPPNSSEMVSLLSKYGNNGNVSMFSEALGSLITRRLVQTCKCCLLYAWLVFR